jgi:hypothetical protein
MFPANQVTKKLQTQINSGKTPLDSLGVVVEWINNGPSKARLSDKDLGYLFERVFKCF